MGTQKGITTNKTYSCAICRSPQRKEIERLWLDRNNIKTRIFEKYKGTIPVAKNYFSFHKMMQRHIKDKHELQNEIVITLQRDSGVLSPEVTIESFAQKLLELGQIKISNMTPDEIKLKDVISAQKLLLDKQKIRLSEDAMTVKMAELFGGVVSKADVITDGEILGETHGDS